jgi:flagella basal body P-ring formation protein FlgA
VLRDVPPDVVVDSAMVNAQSTFHNRIEPDLVNSIDLVIGKKTKYGLNKGQLVVKDDLAN